MTWTVFVLYESIRLVKEKICSDALCALSKDKISIHQFKKIICRFMYGC